MGKVIDGRAFFKLSSWLPEVDGMQRIEVIREWLALEAQPYCGDCGDILGQEPCHCQQEDHHHSKF